MSTEVPSSPEPRQDPKEERTWAMVCHLAALAGYIIPVAGNIVGPLIIWLMKKEQFALVNDQGRESLNFQISITIYAIIAGLLAFVGIGLVLLPVVGIFALVMIIMAAIKANEGVAYRYPLNMRFIS